VLLLSSTAGCWLLFHCYAAALLLPTARAACLLLAPLVQASTVTVLGSPMVPLLTQDMVEEAEHLRPTGFLKERATSEGHSRSLKLLSPALQEGGGQNCANSAQEVRFTQVEVAGQQPSPAGVQAQREHQQQQHGSFGDNPQHHRVELMKCRVCC
jgi:hypothetical protein